MYGYLDGDGLVHRCCVCRKIRYNDGNYRDLVLPNYIWRISDGYCPNCLKAAMEEFDRHYAEEERKRNGERNDGAGER